ncbi:MAG: nuclear transport factor 2 family protein [Rubrivivax sp.]
MVTDTAHPLAIWHRLVENRDPSDLDTLLADDAVFHSPVVHTPQHGKRRCVGYLSAALQVFGNPSFRYVREIVGEHDAMLEFETEIDGITVNGIDLIRWNDAGQIVDFKVMVRPLKAMQVIQQQMATMLGPRHIPLNNPV